MSKSASHSESAEKCGLCGGHGRMMRLTDKALVKCGYCDGTRIQSNLGSNDARDAALWRDLVLLHPMDMVMLFSAAMSDKILLDSLEVVIEKKRSSSNDRNSAHEG